LFPGQDRLWIGAAFHDWSLAGSFLLAAGFLPGFEGLGDPSRRLPDHSALGYWSGLPWLHVVSVKSRGAEPQCSWRRLDTTARHKRWPLVRSCGSPS